jgi:hypothetical protein
MMRFVSPLAFAPAAAVLFSTGLWVAQGHLPGPGSDFRTIHVVFEDAGGSVSYVPARFRLTDGQGRPSGGFTCTDIGHSIVLIAANVEPDVDPAEISELTSKVRAEFGDTVRVRRLPAERREAWLTLGKATFNIGGVTDDPFGLTVVWEEVEKRLLDNGKRPILTVRIFWTEPLQARDVQYRFDWESVSRELSSRAGGSKRISRVELYSLAAYAVKKRWVAAAGPASSSDALSGSDLLNLVATLIAHTLLSPPQTEPPLEDDADGDKSTFYALRDKVDLSSVSFSVDLRRSVEVQRTLIIRQELPSCL